MTRPKAWLSVAILAMAMAVAGCGSPQWRTASGSVWGTAYHITYESSDDLSDSIVAVMAEIGESLSMFSPTSNVSRINSGTTDSTDAHFKAVYDISRQVSEASGGKFDPTVAPLVDLWGFGRAGRDVPLPDSAQIAKALENVGIGKTDLHDNRIDRHNRAVQFDFSAVAKGYGVEKVAEMLHRNGANNYMVEIGGEIQLKGHNPKGSKWRIQVDAPVQDSEPGDSALTVLELTDCGIATSGNYRNYREYGSENTVGHTINPLTGHPAPNHLLSATVIAPGCAVADALATALMASEPDSIAAILNKFPSTRAIVVLPSGRTLRFN